MLRSQLPHALPLLFTHADVHPCRFAPFALQETMIPQNTRHAPHAHKQRENELAELTRGLKLCCSLTEHFTIHMSYHHSSYTPESQAPAKPRWTSIYQPRNQVRGELISGALKAPDSQAPTQPSLHTSRMSTLLP